MMADRLMTTGFLDGTHPIVECYELKVWVISHLIRRPLSLSDQLSAHNLSSSNSIIISASL